MYVQLQKEKKRKEKLPKRLMWENVECKNTEIEEKR